LIAPQQQPVRLDLTPWLLDDIPPLEDFGAPVGGDVPVEEDGEGFEWEHHPLLCGTFLLSVYSIEALSVLRSVNCSVRCGQRGVLLWLVGRSVRRGQWWGWP
jgi:hypothetical protein